MIRKRVTLALQGGGSHGAFTWGVLDRVLEDERIEIEGISGASAGAINAALLAAAIITNKHPEYRIPLETYRQQQTDNVNANPDPRQVQQ